MSTEMRPKGMRQVRVQTPLGLKEVVAIDTSIEFRTEHGDIRVSWDAGTGRVKVYALAATNGMTVPPVLDALDVRPVQSNVVSIGFTGEPV